MLRRLYEQKDFYLVMAEKGYDAAVNFDRPVELFPGDPERNARVEAAVKATAKRTRSKPSTESAAPKRARKSPYRTPSTPKRRRSSCCRGSRA